MLSAWMLSALPPVAAGQCTGELLYNGICLPRGSWPPRWPGSGGLPPRDPVPPPWLSDPPAVINITLGRQLFVDKFLIASMPGLQLLSHAAEWEGQVLKATEPWEATRKVPKASWPQNSRAIGYANPVSGGVWWDEHHCISPKPCFRAWYACGSQSDETTAAGMYGCCYAESPDGVHWSKPRVGSGAVRGTNIVLHEAYDGNVVWLDHEAPAEQRWKMATVPRWFGFAQFHWLTSPDGIHWTSQRNGSGSIGDRSTFFYNPFRKVWVYSIKYLFPTPEWGLWGRARAYREGADLIADANWSAPGEADGVTPWTGADANDPTWPYNGSLQAELYNLDGAAYESVMVGLFQVFRGFTNENATAGDKRTSGEHDELYLGFSRDGFHWWRQYDGDAQAGGAMPRRPFLPQSWPVHSWRNSGVGSVGGGFVLGADERLRFYASGNLGLPFDAGWSGGNASMGVASLRRDGFTSVEAMLPGEPGTLTTRPVVWDADRHLLFVNVVVQPGGFVQVAVRDEPDSRTLAGFELDNSTVGPLSRAACLPDDAPAFDSTRVLVKWARGASLASVAGRPVRLQFRLVAASLYSFWVARTPCGASDGYLGAGGPRAHAGRDVHGDCQPGGK